MTTYSTSLKLTLLADGEQSGTWGTTTNNNLGTLLEQAITGYVAIDMADANVTLTNLNGTTDQARNAVIELYGTNTGVRDVIPPVVEKLYTIYNNTTGGYSIRVIGATGTGVTIPNGMTALVYCNGTNFVNGLSGTAGSFAVVGTITSTGAITSSAGISGTTGTFSGAITSDNPTFTGTVTVPTPVSGSNTTVAASTAYVTNAVATLNSSLGTMAAQNANNVNITGGTIAGITDLVVADGGTGSSALTANSVILGNGTSPLSGNMVAPGNSGNALVSNGTTWVSGIPSIKGLGFGGETWKDASGTYSANSGYTNNYGYPIAMNAGWSNGSGYFTVNGVDNYSSSGANGNTNTGVFVIIPTGATWSFNYSGAGIQRWVMLT